MKLTQEQKEQLEPIYNLLKDCCNCIYVAGSFIDDNIRDKRDIDICVIVNSNLERKKYARIRIENKDLFNSLKEQNFSIFSNLRENVAEKFNPYSYQYNFDDFEVLFGEPDFEFKKDILEEKDDYKLCLSNAFGLINEESINTNLYRVLEGIYFMENDSFGLTQEQIENINIAHDKTDIDKIIELYNYCNEYLN